MLRRILPNPVLDPVVGPSGLQVAPLVDPMAEDSAKNEITCEEALRIAPSGWFYVDSLSGDQPKAVWYLINNGFCNFDSDPNTGQMKLKGCDCSRTP